MAIPKDRISAFKPDAKKFHILTQNDAHAGLDNIACSRLVVLDDAGSSALYLHQDNSECHHFHQPAEGCGADTLNIQTTPIDIFLSNQIGGVHFIKINAQGR